MFNCINILYNNQLNFLNIYIPNRTIIFLGYIYIYIYVWKFLFHFAVLKMTDDGRNGGNVYRNNVSINISYWEIKVVIGRCDTTGCPTYSMSQFECN
jgi:hypothetical protein